MLFLATLCSRPPVSRAAPQPEKLQKNNVTKKKKLVEVSRLNYFAFNLILMFLDPVDITICMSYRYLQVNLNGPCGSLIPSTFYMVLCPPSQ